MPFLLLLVLMFSCLPVNWPQPPPWVGAFARSFLAFLGLESSESADWLGSILLTWSGVLALAAVAWLMSRLSRRRLRYHPEEREVLVRRQGAFRFYHFLALLAFYAAALYLLGWGWVVQGAWPNPGAPSTLFPGFELLIVTPLLAALVASWISFYDVERDLHSAADSHGASTYWTRWAYVAFHLRQNIALVFVPVLLLIILNNLVRLMPQSEASQQNLAGGLSIAAALSVFSTMPWILRLVLGLKPMPAGELRTRLVGACRRLRFRCSNILIWNTRGGVVNAMVVGIFPFLRYVILTDRLVAEMTPDEVESVFGHEVGHIKHRHMWYYLVFILMSLPVLIQIWQIAELERLFDLGARKDLALLPLVAVLGTYMFVVFGFLSRRCERQADIYGCRTVSCGRRDCCGHESEAELLPRARGLCRTGIHVFINALEKVAYLNGISRDRPGWLQSWQHSTIARRVDFLQRVSDDPLLERRFQRRVALVKCGLLLTLVAALALIGTTTSWSNIFSF
jgi:Zn-dependent protease with chaperone function